MCVNAENSDEETDDVSFKMEEEFMGCGQNEELSLFAFSLQLERGIVSMFPEV